MGIPGITPYDMPEADQLPANRVRWQVDPSRAALLIHDMQRYFVDFFPAGHQPVISLVHNAAALRRAADLAGMPVLYTAQPGGMSPADRGLLADVWGPGMSTDPLVRQIVPELAPTDQDIVLTKWRYSAFARSDLADILRDTGRDQLVICGIYAHIGCLMTAADAFTRDIQPFLVADAVADFSAGYHRMALEYAAEACAATPVTHTVVEALRRPAMSSAA